jgi:ABC-2 type transport system ATP-binding protein
MSAQPIIDLQDMSVRFGDFSAASHVTIQVWPGEIFGLVGPSGSGKTTIIRTLTGNVRPTRGECRVLGAAPDHFRRATRERIGYLPQHFVLYPDLSLYSNLNFVASIYGMGWRWRRRALRQVLRFVELWDRRDISAGSASGGMQRRLGLAGALVHGPTLVFLDEPTAGIDPVLRRKFWEQFAQLKASGRTLFITTQYVTESEYCDRVAVLNKGQLVAVGAPAELRRRALGGELVDVALPNLSVRHLQGISALPQVKAVQALGTDHARVVVEESASAIPEIVRKLEASGGGAPRVEEVRPTFDEVFVSLIEQHNLYKRAPDAARSERVPVRA